MTKRTRQLIDRYAVAWAAIEAVGGPSAAARIWGMSVRRAIGYHTGERKLPLLRRQHLAAALRAQAARATRIADRLDPPRKR